MKRAASFTILLMGLASFPAPVSAEPYTVVTYNLGLLRVFGSDYVPAVEARTRAAPAALSAFVAAEKPQVLLLEEVWEDAAADAVSKALAPLGYSAVKPNVRSIIGLTSGLLLLVKEPLRVAEWKFTPFSRTTFIDSFARKGVLEAVLEDLSTGARFAVVGTHTVAVDTNNGQPKDKGQLDAIFAQADQIRAAVTARSSNGSLPVLLLGDFNVGPGYVDSAYSRISSLEGLRESGEVLHPVSSLVTWDPGNPLVKYGSYPNEPPAKIDHVFLLDGSGALWTPTAARVVMSEAQPGLLFTPKGSAAQVPTPLSDHYAFLAEVDLSPR
jgi:endonuclease/exonuclease/phosphatase family metal-dependent hydrolase